jgi:hypothetical protein
MNGEKIKELLNLEDINTLFFTIVLVLSCPVLLSNQRHDIVKTTGEIVQGAVDGQSLLSVSLCPVLSTQIC